MTNAWSLLYDEMNDDTLNLGSHLPGAASPDTITFTSTGYDGIENG